MNRRRFNWPLLGGLLLSLMLHVVAIGPLMAMMSSSTPIQSMDAQFDDDDVLLPKPKREDPQPPLGLDEGTASTLTWVGYDEYQEHMAELSEVEQAAFTPHTHTTPPRIQIDSSPPTSLTQTPVNESISVPESELIAQSDSPPSGEGQSATPNQSTSILPDLAVKDVPTQISQASEFSSEPKTTPFNVGDEESAPSQTNDPQEPAIPQKKQTPEPIQMKTSMRQLMKTLQQMAAAYATAARQIPTPDSPSESEPEPGDPADKQAQPTSVVDVSLDDIKIGKPLAAQGLELLPRKPEFTTLQMLTASPGNPLVFIMFGPDGIPRKAGVVETSGDYRIDEAIRNSLYRWRAQGKPLEKITGDQTIDIPIRLILTRRALP